MSKNSTPAECFGKRPGEVPARWFGLESLSTPGRPVGLGRRGNVAYSTLMGLAPVVSVALVGGSETSLFIVSRMNRCSV